MKDLDLDDVVAHHPQARFELAEMKKALDDLLELCELNGFHAESAYIRCKNIWRTLARGE